MRLATIRNDWNSCTYIGFVVGIYFDRTQVWSKWHFSQDNIGSLFPLWKLIGILKSKFSDDELLWRSSRPHTDVWNHSHRMVKLKWPIDNVVGPHFSGYKLLKKNIWNLEGFWCRNFPESFWHDKNSTVDDSSVRFYHAIAIQPKASCLSRQNQNHKVSYLFCTQV